MAHLQISQIIPATRLDAFAYLTNPQMLPELLEPHIQVEVLSPEVSVQRGHEFHFMMTRLGLTQSVRLRIEDCLRGSRFTYRQVEGLFLTWTHSIRFEEHGERMTVVSDIVDYTLPMGVLGSLADDLIVKRDMTRLLESRLQKAKQHFLNEAVAL